jgi:hypothetical protein
LKHLMIQKSLRNQMFPRILKIQKNLKSQKIH